MLKLEREQELVQLLQKEGYLSVHELSRQLYTSESTIRRILTVLERKGLIRRSYGGAELQSHFAQPAPLHSRAKEHTEAKRQIAAKAAALVPDGSILFLDQSSTSFFLAEALLKKKAMTVVTNSLETAALLAQSDFEVFVCGGSLSQQMRMCMVGEDAQRLFREIHADFAFFSARSLSDDGVISDCYREEVCVRKAMLETAKTRVFLCDSSKFGTHSGYRQCDLNQVDILISEATRAEQFSHFRKDLRIL